MDFWTAFLLCGAMASVVARAVALVAYGSVKQSSAGVNHGIRGIHGMGFLTQRRGDTQSEEGTKDNNLCESSRLCASALKQKKVPASSTEISAII